VGVAFIDVSNFQSFVTVYLILESLINFNHPHTHTLTGIPYFKEINIKGDAVLPSAF
jgi:hypothetical protein